MKIAIISDIHGNMQALEAVLNDIQKQNCEQILCLGDLALAGPEPEKTIDFAANQNWMIIQGNTDKLISDFTSEIEQNVKSAFPIMGNALVDDVNKLNQTQKDYLKNLPPQKTLTIDGIKILLVHGSPRRNNEDILPDKPITEIEEMLDGIDSDLIFCGHTHIPCGYQTNKKQTVVNVGSVGRPFTDNAMACYAVADIEHNNFTIEHRFVDYNRKLAADILSKRKFDGANKLAGILLNPTSRHL